MKPQKKSISIPNILPWISEGPGGIPPRKETLDCRNVDLQIAD